MEIRKETNDEYFRENLYIKLEVLESERRLERQIYQLDLKVNDIEVRLSNKINDVEMKLSSRINEVEAKLSNRINDVEIKLSETKTTLLLWIGASTVATVTSIIGYMHLFLGK